MLLKGKVAVIYGAGGAVGSAVARAFGREGARVYLAGQTAAKLEAVATTIEAEGGTAVVAPVDALDQMAVDEHADEVFRQSGALDISFNAIELGDTQGAPLLEMDQERFALPIVTAMQTQFYTATAGARHMAKCGSGVILTITANAARKPYPNVGGFGVACAAIEALSRQLAAELGPKGIRLVNLRSGGSPDAAGVAAAMQLHAENAGVSVEEIIRRNGGNTMLGRMPLLREVANAAVLMASDRASAITAAVTNVTCGELAD